MKVYANKYHKQTDILILKEDVFKKMKIWEAEFGPASRLPRISFACIFMLCFVLAQSYLLKLYRVRSEFKTGSNAMNLFHNSCEILAPLQSYITLLPLPCMLSDIYKQKVKFVTFVPDPCFPYFFLFVFLLSLVVLYCHLPMTSIPPTFLLPPPPPSYNSYKYFPFSFQWKLMLIKRCTKSSVIWAWGKPSKLSSEAFAVVKAMSKPSSLSETFLLSSITNFSEKNTSLHFACRCLYIDRHVGSMMTFCNRR